VGCSRVILLTHRSDRAQAVIGAQRRKARREREKIKRSTYGVEDSAERTTQLAADRTVFAAERTYAAWVRTGLLALASGIGAKALLSEVVPQWLIIATGTVLVLFSAFCFGAAVWRHLEPGVPPPRVDVSRIPAWVLVAVNGFLALVALAALVGIWFGRTSGVSH
jgi:putative membrane protein